MFIRLLFFFTLVPVAELYVLLQVGSQIGVGATIALIILTGIAGAYLARTQGFDLLRRIQTELSAGRLPTSELLDGAMVLAGGIVLLTPGFLTDITGFVLLVPFTRNLIKGMVRHWLQKAIDSGQITFRRF